MSTPAIIEALTAFRAKPEPEAFPYDDVVAEFHRSGKHFVAPELLRALDGVRSALPATDGPYRRLAGFLGTALDKFDGRYDNPSYLALSELPLPGTGGACPRGAANQRDRLLALLIADTLRFELDALDETAEFLPEMRPDARTVAKRAAHCVRALRPSLERLGLAAAVTAEDAVEAARQARDAVFGGATPGELRTLQLTALPVYVAHDEYMFMRVLQSYETTFALIGVQLRAAIEAVGRGDGAVGTRAIAAAEETLSESSPLWSLCGTMQPEAFLKFREYTDGASAIQSRNYKLIESLCRRPDADRLDGAAFAQVPEIREQVETGLPNLDDALAAARAAGVLTVCHHARVRAAMAGFEAAVMKWRQTHYRMAVRMLGDRRGTGGSEGQAYLDQGRTIPVFLSACPAGHGGRTHGESDHGAPAGCPMHGRRSFGSGRREAPTHH